MVVYFVIMEGLVHSICEMVKTVEESLIIETLFGRTLRDGQSLENNILPPSGIRSPG